MPTPLTLSQLLAAETQGAIAARLTAALGARGLPVSSWTSGGVEMTTVNMIAGTLSKLASGKLARGAAMRFIDLAKGDDLTFLAAHFYQLDRQPATFTIQNIFLTAVPTAPAVSFGVGELWVASLDGNRYQSIDAVTAMPGRSVSVRCQAENAGASYADAAGTVTQMVVAPAGISCVNKPPSDYLPARHTGFSTGSIQAQGQDDDHVDPPVVGVVRVRIDASGNIGSGLFSFRLDDGPWTSGGPITGVFFAPGPSGDWRVDGNRLIFKNGGGNPSFVAGDVFTMVRADAILQRGADAWSDATLRKLCRAKWSTLSSVPTEGSITLMAHLASPEVRRVIVDADPETPGGVLVTIASGSGPASGQAQLDVADYITPRLNGFQGIPDPPSGIARSPAETVTVQSAAAGEITPGGNVFVPKAKLVATQQAADLAWQAYLDSIDLGGEVILAKLEEIVLDAGAVSYAGVTLNGVNQNVQLAANQVAVPAPGTSLITSLFWNPM